MLSNYSSIPSCPYDQCASSHIFRMGTAPIFGAQISRIAPPPSAELESRNPFVLGQFLTIDLPLSSTFKRLNFRPSPEFPIVIGEKNILIGYRIPLSPPLSPLLPRSPLHHNPRPFKNSESTLNPISHRNDNTGAEEALQ